MVENKQPQKIKRNLTGVLTSSLFSINESDKYVYYKFNGLSGEIMFLYVDAMFIFRTNKNLLRRTKMSLSQHIEIKDLGEVNVILEKLFKEIMS